jgi:hypothetical protein
MRHIDPWRGRVIQPLENVSKGEEALVEDAHDLGVLVVDGLLRLPI